MPIISLLTFSSKFTLQYLLHDSTLDSSNISPFQWAWHEALSAKQTEGILQKSGGFFSGFRSCILVCLTPAAGSTHGLCVEGHLLDSASAVHPQHPQWPHFPGQTLVTTLPQPPPCISGLAPTAGFKHPFTLPYQSCLLYSEGCFLVLGNWWPALAQRTSLLLWAAATLSSKGLTSSHGRGAFF